MRQKKTLEKRELNKVRRNLPRGWQKKLSEETGKSTSTINKVMHRLRNNSQVLAKAIDLCGLAESEKTTLKSKLLFIL
ncbi:MAG: hypothetical protein U0X71_04860 [Sphingobacteriaceae bacterium]|jgi:uncharacterized protein YerC